MISTEKAEGIEEIFVVRNESIDFFGALVKEGDGNWTVKGMARFCDGETLTFHHPSGDRKISREKLLCVSKAIANFYQTNYFHQKFDQGIGLS